MFLYERFVLIYIYMSNLSVQINLHFQAKVGMFEGIIEPTLLYGCETWEMKKRDRKRKRKRIEAVSEMNYCLRNIILWCKKNR